MALPRRPSPGGPADDTDSPASRPAAVPAGADSPAAVTTQTAGAPPVSAFDPARMPAAPNALPATPPVAQDGRIVLPGRAASEPGTFARNARELHQVEAKQYVAAGEITSDMLLNGSPGEFSELDDSIVEVTMAVQDRLKEQGEAKNIEHARAHPAERKPVVDLIDREVLKFINSKSMVRGEKRKYLIAAVINEIIGLGPIEPLAQDPRITEIMVNSPNVVYVEINGQTVRVPGCRFRNAEHLLQVCNAILRPLNKAIDVTKTMADGRTGDGSRVNSVHDAVGYNGPFLTIRKFPDKVWTMKDLIENGSVDEEMALELAFLVNHKCSILVAGGTGAGKALDVDTTIPTPAGPVRMGDLMPGDTVFDERGAPCLVTAVFDQPPGRPCYKVGFSDGTTVVADADHNWLTETRAAGRTAGDGQRRQPQGPAVVTTAEIAATLRTPGGHPNHSVRVATGPAVFPEQTGLPIDPYLLGFWLGNGPVSKAEVGIGNPGAALQTTEVLDRGRVPDVYLYASEPQRRALLAGLMDSSGTHGEGPSVLFSNTDEALALQVRSLVASLGHQAVLRKDTAVLDGIERGPCYEVVFDAHEDVFRFSREAAAGHRQERQGGVRGVRVAHRYITSVRSVPSRDVRCITVDSPSHLFLCTDQYLPTHNTSLLNALSSCIPRDERVITIEDSIELRLHPDAHVLAMEARPPSANGKGDVTIRALLRNALRMNPKRIVVGECRGAEALDMLQACNTGHDGSMTTVHANDPEAALQRLSVLVAQAGEIPPAQVGWLIAEALDVIVFQRKFEDGTRRVEAVHEIPGPSHVEANGRIKTIPLWVWEQTGTKNAGSRDLLVGKYRRVNEMSEELRRRRRLSHFAPMTMADIYRMSELPEKNT